MTIFFLNLILLIIFFIYFKLKITNELSLKKIKDEINETIILFNRNLERKIIEIDYKFKVINKNNSFKKTREKKNASSFPSQKKNLRTSPPPNKPLINKLKKLNYPRNLKEKIKFFSYSGLSNREIAEKLLITIDEVKLNLVK